MQRIKHDLLRYDDAIARLESQVERLGEFRFNKVWFLKLGDGRLVSTVTGALIANETLRELSIGELEYIRNEIIRALKPETVIRVLNRETVAIEESK